MFRLARSSFLLLENYKKTKKFPRPEELISWTKTSGGEQLIGRNAGVRRTERCNVSLRASKKERVRWKVWINTPLGMLTIESM